MFSKICNFLKGFILVPVPEDFQDEFEISVRRINVTRAKIISVTFIVMEVVQLVISLMIKKANILKRPDIYYLAMYGLMLIAMVVFLSVFNKLGKDVPGHIKDIQKAGITFTTFVLLWCVGISLLDQLSSGQIIVYAIAVIATAVTPFYKPITLLYMFLPTYAVFLVLLPYFQKSSEMLIGNYINSITFLIFSCVIAGVRYKGLVEDFKNKIIIQEKKAELERVNKELEEANQKLEKLSQTDGLTGIFNRYVFDLILKTEWENCKRHFMPLSLIMIDIDYFKAYNDNYGHPAGDYCIKEVAKVLSGCARRASDIVTRYGGDEFAIILPNMKRERVIELAELMRRKVEELEIPHEYSGASKYLTISLGVYSAIPSGKSTIEEFLKAADEALYEAKKENRNKITSAL